MSKKISSSPLLSAVKVGILMVGCTALCLVVINFLAAYQLGSSILLGALATAAILK